MQNVHIMCVCQSGQLRVIILNRGSTFAFQWREFSPSLSSAHRLLQCYNRQKRDRKRYNSRGIPPQPPVTWVVSQWASSLEWHHAVTLHILVGKICISFFLFYCEGMLPLVVLRLCGGQRALSGLLAPLRIFTVSVSLMRLQLVLPTQLKYTHQPHYLNTTKNNSIANCC